MCNRIMWGREGNGSTKHRRKGGNALTPTEFKRSVKHRLIDLDMTQDDLIARVREATGMYLDRSYLNKIYNGKYHPKKIIKGIREILDLPEE